MFRPNGFLHTTPLNHYIRVRVDNGKYEFWANAGVLLEAFRTKYRYGFKTMKEFITLAKKELSKASVTEHGVNRVQETSLSESGRDTGIPSGVDHQGE